MVHQIDHLMNQEHLRDHIPREEHAGEPPVMQISDGRRQSPIGVSTPMLPDTARF